MVKNEKSVISQTRIEDGDSIQDTSNQRPLPIESIEGVTITNDRVEIHV